MKRKKPASVKKAGGYKHHMIRVADHAYNELLGLYAEFMEKVHSEPQLYPAYAGRRVSLSEVLALACKGARNGS